MSHYFLQIERQILEDGDDETVVTATEAFDPEVLDPKACEEVVEKIQQRYDESQIKKIGISHIGGYRDGTIMAVTLVCGSEKRLALFKFGEAHAYLQAHDVFETERETKFLGFVDPNFEAMALARQNGNFQTTFSIDVTRPQKGESDNALMDFPEIRAWAEPLIQKKV